MPIYAQKLDLGVILKPSWNLAGTKMPTKTHQVVQKGSRVSRRGVPFDDLVLETAARDTPGSILVAFCMDPNDNLVQTAPFLASNGTLFGFKRHPSGFQHPAQNVFLLFQYFHVLPIEIGVL